MRSVEGISGLQAGEEVNELAIDLHGQQWLGKPCPVIEA
jgi:hypothetical protein